jgi:hypothetical protein
LSLSSWAACTLTPRRARRARPSFAIAQAFAAYGMSFLFVRSGRNYLLLFALGSCALVLALVVSWAQWAVAHSTNG